jgi:hypothetical protein
MLEVEHIGIISDEMREVVEELWPELVHKLPPKAPQGWTSFVSGAGGWSGRSGAERRHHPLGVARRDARPGAAQEQIDGRMAKNWRGDLDPLANSVTSLFVGH